MPPTKHRKSSPDLVSQEVKRRHELEKYQAEIAALNEKVAAALARGTQDLPLQLPLDHRAFAYLMDHTADLRGLAKALDAEPEEVEGVLHTLRKEGKIANIGLEYSPKWTAIVGDEIETSALNVLVLRLISERPMTVRELQVATGARLGRVGGAIVSAQRTAAVIDVEPAQRAGRYYVIPEHRDARLTPKVEGGTEPEGD